MKVKANTALRPLVRSVAVALGLSFVAPAFSQVATPTAPGQTPQDIDPARRTPALQPALIDPRALSVSGDCAFAGKGEVTLTRIDVTGATLVGREAIDAAVADLLGRPSDAAVLCTARDRVAALYAARGEALSRVDLPEQRMSDGVLTLRVTEGRLVSTLVQNAQAQGPSAELARAYLSNASGDGATRWRDVERAFMQIREIPGAEPRFALRRASDGSDDGLEVAVDFAPRRRFDFIVNAQNLGSEELGREGASLRVDGNSLTRFGDRTSLVLFSSFGGEQKVVQLMEEVRLGASGWLVLADFAYGRSRPGGGLAPLELEGSSKVGRLGARYGWIKQRDAAVDIGMRLEAIDQKNDLGFLRSVGLGTVPLFEERLRVLALEANGRWQPRAMPQLNTGFGLELRQGLDALGASDNGDALLSRAEGRTDFTSLRANAAARWTSIAGGARPYMQAAASGQWTADALPAYEEFQIGNYTVGRGFDPGAASAERAVALQLEGGVDLARGTHVISLFGFADGARLWNLDAGSYDSSPWSAGVGLRLRGRAGQLEATYAVPQDPAVPGVPTPDERLLVTYTHSFSIR